MVWTRVLLFMTKPSQLGVSFAFNFDPPFYVSLLLLEGSFKKGALYGNSCENSSFTLG